MPARCVNLGTRKSRAKITHRLPDLRLGEHTLFVKLFIAGRTYPHAVHTSRLRVVKRMPKVFIDERRRLIVDGKPFFPLGLYLGPTGDEHLRRIADAGFNTILCYGYGVGADPEGFLNRAQRYGLKVIYSIKDFYEGTRWFPKLGKSGLELAREYVTKLRHHPALLGWYINDELPPKWVPELTKMYELVSSLDPDHPQFQVLYQVDELHLYYNCTDIMGVDPYPIPQHPISIVADWTKKAVKAMHGVKPVWVVTQIFAKGNYTGDVRHREPTFAEKRCMFYLALIHGAQGLIAYSYFDLLRTIGGKPAPRDLFERRWREIRAIIHEVKQLIPVLLEGKDVSHIPRSVAKGKVHMRALTYNDRLYLLFANVSDERIPISIKLPKRYKHLKRMDAPSAVTALLSQAHLRAQLEPLEAGTYIVWGD